MNIKFGNINRVLAGISGIQQQASDGVKEAVEISLRDVQERTRNEHVWISRTGQAEREIRVRSVAKDFEASGAVYTTLPHGIYLHTGTRPHQIVPKRKKALRFVRNGSFIFAKRVHHPGTKGDEYIYHAFDAETPVIISRFNALAAKIAVMKE